MENMIIEKVHVSEIVSGDSIVCGDGHIRTVCSKDIRKDKFCGDSIFGYGYNCGTIRVERVKFRVPTNKGIVYR